MRSLLATLFLIPLVSCFPRHSHHRRQNVNTNSFSGKFESVSVGPYTVSNNLWGETDAAGGSQSSKLVSYNNDILSWETTWTWTGGSQVKSFANAQLNQGINQQLDAISSMPTTWNWSQTITGSAIADVAYDLFTSWSSGGGDAYEVMIWLANINSGPISYNYDQWGHAVPIATNLAIVDQTWNLYYGFNGVNFVYSFLLTTNDPINSFEGDIYEFFSYLIDNQGLNSSQYLTVAQAGTEANTGSATFYTSGYQLSII